MKVDSNFDGDERHEQHGQQNTTFRLAGALVTLKATGATTKNAFAVIEWMLPAHHQGLWPHWHRNSEEALYVVQGTVACTLNEETIVMRAGSFLYLPTGATHHIWNPAAAPVTYLTTFVPAGPEGFFGALAATRESTGEATATNSADRWPVELDRMHSIGGENDHFFDRFLVPVEDRMP